MTKDTIAAIATPNAIGGISMIRISGPDAHEIADRVFVSASGKALKEHAGYTGAFGTAADEEGTIDEAIAFVYRGPKSYTGEDTVEITCHGGIVVTRRLLRAVLDKGARLALPGEFTKRAFLNGKMTLTQAESVLELINSQSDQAARYAVTALEGALYRKIEGLTRKLLEQTSHITAWIDFPEEDIDQVKRDQLTEALQKIRGEISDMVRTFDIGKIIHYGVNTAIVGRPNVGKSTLMNLLSGSEKSIVTEVAGTTRDVVEETVNLGSIVLRLADTAGIHHTENAVEQAGVERAKKRIEEADLVLLVLDVSQKLQEEDRELLDLLRGKNAVVVFNKADLGVVLDQELVKKDFPETVLVSAKDPAAVGVLDQAVSREMNLAKIDTNQPILANERQREAAVDALGSVDDALGALSFGMTLDAVNISIEEAVSALLRLTGEEVSDAVIEDVFSRFCVGK